MKMLKRISTNEQTDYKIILSKQNILNPIHFSY